MKPSTKRLLSILLTGTFFVLALIIYSSLIRPEYKKIQNLRSSLASKTSLFEQQKSIISQVQTLLAQYESAAQLQETVSLALPIGEDAASLFQQIFSISQLSGLGIQSFNLKPLAIKQNNLGSIQVDLRLFGSYNAFKSFIGSLETNIRVMDVSRFRVQPAGAATQDFYSYDLTINTYYQQ